MMRKRDVSTDYLFSLSLSLLYYPSTTLQIRHQIHPCTAWALWLQHDGYQKNKKQRKKFKLKETKEESNF
jgi:hypothetical protein